VSEEIIREYTNAKLAHESMQMRNISGLTPDERFELDKESAAVQSRYFKATDAYRVMINESCNDGE